MVVLKDNGRRIDEFQRAARPIFELFQCGEQLTAEQENTLIGTIHDLQMEYNDWMLTRQPLKEQCFPPHGGG